MKKVIYIALGAFFMLVGTLLLVILLENLMLKNITPSWNVPLFLVGSPLFWLGINTIKDSISDPWDKLAAIKSQVENGSQENIATDIKKQKRKILRLNISLIIMACIIGIPMLLNVLNYINPNPYKVGSTGYAKYLVLKDWLHTGDGNIYFDEYESDIYRSENGRMYISCSSPKLDMSIDIDNYFFIETHKASLEDSYAEIYPDTKFGDTEKSTISRRSAARFNIEMDGMSGVGYVTTYNEGAYLIMLLGDVSSMEKEIITNITFED